MRRFLLKATILVIFLVSIFLTFGYFFLDTQAADKLANTFVASSSNINELSAETANVTGSTSTSVFNEFTEDTIDKNGFYIRIDKINLFKTVVKDVDPRYESVYKKSWEIGVSHGKFTSYPDQIGITYIFGHATSDKEHAADEMAWFSNLDQMQLGDTVILYYQGVKYTYEITEFHVVDPTATGFYTGVSAVPMIRLQYCAPPTGSLSYRTLIDGILVDKETL